MNTINSMYNKQCAHYYVIKFTDYVEINVYFFIKIADKIERFDDSA